MNKKWFETRWQNLGMSQNEVARRMGMSNPALSRMFSEMRRMRLDEAVRIASILEVEVLDVLRASGAMEATRPARKALLPKGKEFVQTEQKHKDMVSLFKDTTSRVLGWLDADGVVHEKGLVGPTVVSLSSDMIHGCDALRFQKGPFDGWLVYFDQTGRSPGEGVELLCVVDLTDGRRVLRMVKRGYGPNNYVLTKMDGSSGENSEISIVRPVVCMKQRG